MSLGIDLGCTNSCSAFNGIIIHSLSSIINIQNDKLNVGGKYINGINIFYTKQYIGRKYSELSNDEKFDSIFDIKDDEDDNILINGFSPEILTSLIIKELKIISEKKISKFFDSCVIAVPVYFNHLQRQAIKYSCELADFKKIKIINEPIASCLIYIKNNPSSKKVVILDYGSLTFDASILDIDKELISVVSSCGNNSLGGKNIDKKLCEYIKKKYKLNDINSDFINKCEKLKQELSYVSEKGFYYFDNYICITRNELELNILYEEFKEVSKILETLCNKCPNDKFDEILITGGSSKIPSFKTFIQNYFHKNINSSLTPEISVAQGASLASETLCIDSVPFDLGTESSGGLMSVVIPKDTKIPCSLQKTFSTACDNQPSVMIHIYEGNNSLCCDNTLCSTFELCGIPPFPRGIPQINIEFKIDTNGLLLVTASEKSTDIQKSIKVKLKSRELNGLSVYNILKKYDKTNELMKKNNIIARENLKEYIHEIYKTKHLLDSKNMLLTNKLLDETNRWINDNYETTADNFLAKEKELVAFYHHLITSKK